MNDCEIGPPEEYHWTAEEWAAVAETLDADQSSRGVAFVMNGQRLDPARVQPSQ